MSQPQCPQGGELQTQLVLTLNLRAHPPSSEVVPVWTVSRPGWGSPGPDRYLAVQQKRGWGGRLGRRCWFGWSSSSCSLGAAPWGIVGVSIAFCFSPTSSDDFYSTQSLLVGPHRSFQTPQAPTPPPFLCTIPAYVIPKVSPSTHANTNTFW